MPEFGCISIQGLAESMDDVVSVKEEFFRPDIVGGRTLHFFSVYDGHGGSHVVPLNFQIIDYIYTSTHMHYL